MTDRRRLEFTENRVRIEIAVSTLLMLAAVVGLGALVIVSDDSEITTTKKPPTQSTAGGGIEQTQNPLAPISGGLPFGELRPAPQDGQEFFRRRTRGRGRPTPDRSQYTTWEIESQFKDDVFTFVRVKYDSFGGYRPGRQWDNDYPDCDWNFSARLHELTSMKVDPNGKVIRLTDDELFDHPFIFFSNINQMDLSENEVAALRKYLFKGGFMMADDFWAPQSWKHVYREMKRVFPDLEPRELTRDHEIFHLVYEIKGLPQVPSIHAWNQGHTFEYWHGDPQGDEGPHFWGFFDRSDRLMALLCHNNDIGDGWEREGENKEYFTTYSERVSYPLGINIVTYAMTH